jgi:methionyl-tRNA formyltransferase
MKTVILTNGSKHGHEIIRQLKKERISIECIIIEKKMIRKKEINLLKSKLGKASFIIPVIPFKNSIYRIFRKFKYSDLTIKKLKEYCKIVYKVSNLNGKESETLLSSIKPDLIVLGGSRIIKKNILDIPKIGTLNAHPGILPYYRGLDVIKWALYNGDKPGVTIHFVNSGIDTGEICTYEELELTDNISINDIKEQAIKVSSQLISKTVLKIDEIGKINTYSNQADKGKYYARMPNEIHNKLIKKLSKNEQ